MEITRLIYSKFLCPDAPSGANVGLHDAVGESLSPIYTTRLSCLHLNHGLLIHIIDANSAPKACLAGEEPQQDLAETKPVLRATARRGYTLVVTKPDRLARSGPPQKHESPQQANKVRNRRRNWRQDIIARINYLAATPEQMSHDCDRTRVPIVQVNSVYDAVTTPSFICSMWRQVRTKWWQSQKLMTADDMYAMLRRMRRRATVIATIMPCSARDRLGHRLRRHAAG